MQCSKGLAFDPKDDSTYRAHINRCLLLHARKGTDAASETLSFDCYSKVRRRAKPKQ